MANEDSCLHDARTRDECYICSLGDECVRLRAEVKSLRVANEIAEGEAVSAYRKLLNEVERLKVELEAITQRHGHCNYNSIGQCTICGLHRPPTHK